MPLAECAHFGQQRTAQALYDTVVARYTSPATAALCRLLLPYLFPELSAFATVEDLHLLAAETSVVAVSAARGTPRTPFFEGCSPSPLAPSYAFNAAVYVLGAEDVGAASASAKRRSSKGKGGRGGGGGCGGGGGGSSGGGGGSGGGGSGGSGGGSGGFGGGGGGSGESGSSGRGGSGGGRIRAQRGGYGGGQRQQQQRWSETPSPQQLHMREASHSDDAWRAEFGDEAERPRWAELLRSGVAIFDLDYDAILAAMYALPVSAEGDCYLCVPPDPGIEAAALGASESVLPSTVPAEAFHTFTHDSGASHYFFRDSTTLTPLSAPIPVRLADPSGGPVLAHSSTGLPCAAVPSSSLSGLHLPSISTNLVSTAALQDAMVTTTTPGGQRVLICTCTRAGRHLATFTHLPGSSLYTLASKPPQTLLWHHRLGDPSLPRLRGMHSRLLVSGLPRSLPPLPPSPAPPCLPCVEWQQRAVPHSSSFPPTSAPLQTLHMDVKGQVVDVLIPRIRAVCLQLRERFRADIPVLRLHSDRGGEFSSDLLRDFCRGEGILHSFTLSDSPKKNGIAERRIGLIMEVARTSMNHVAAPHFLWPFAIRYAAHQLKLWPRVSLPETSPTLCWTGKVGDASMFRVWGSRAFVRDTSANKLSAHAIPCVFLGFSRDAHGWQFYHPTSRHVFPSHDVTFDESVPFYRLIPYRSSPPPPPPLFLYPGPPPVDPLPPPQGPTPFGVSQVDPLLGTAPVEVAVSSGAARGAASGGAVSGGAEPGGAETEGAGSGGVEPGGAEPAGAKPAGVEPGGAEPEGVEPGGAESKGAESGGVEARGTASSGGLADASPRSTRLRSGAVGAGDSAAGDTGAGGAEVTTGAGGIGGAEAVGPGGARTRGTGAAASGGVGGAGAGDTTERGGAWAGGAGALRAGAGGTRAGGTGAGGGGAVDPGAQGAGGTMRPRSYFVPLLQQVLSVPSSTGLTPPLLCPPPYQSQPPLQPASPLPNPPPYTEQTGGLTERRELASRPPSPVRTGRCVPRLRPPPVPGTHAMALRPSSVPLHVPLPPPPESSLLAVPDPESDRARVASPTVSRLLANVVIDPSFESTAASVLVAELVDFAAACRLDYATSLVAESKSATPPSIGGECALGTDVLEDRQEDFECLAAAVPRFASMLLALEGDPDAPDIPTPRSFAEAITGPYSSHRQAAMDAEMESWKSIGTYVDAVPPSRANIVDGMWIFKVKRPPSSPPTFKARYVARGFSQPQGFDYFQTFSSTLKMTPLRVAACTRRSGCTAHLASLARFLQVPSGASAGQSTVSARRLVSRHDTLRTTLAALGFTPSTADPSLFLRTDTSLPPFYVLVYVDNLVFATADTEALTLVKSELQKRHTCTNLGELRIFLGLQITQDRARRTITLTQSHMVHQVLQRFDFQFSSPQLTPLSTSHSLSAPPLDESVEPSGPYPELVGCLMYLMTCTRPDLAYPLSLLARYVAPGRHQKVHWDAAKRVLCYLCSTSGMGLVLGGRGPVVLTGHADASWVDDSATQRSSLGCTFRLGSGFVSWRSTRSSSVLSSSCEAKIYAGAMAAQELRWLTYLLTDLGEQPRSPPVLYVDNKAMIALCHEHRLEHRTKHIALRYFLAREL
ncbi:unnamed protein product [Closterium sp. NIES-53]